MTGICLKTLADLYSTYYSYNFITKITRERKQQIRFPAITMCNLNRFDISQQNLTDTELKYLRRKGDLRNFFQSIDWEGEEGRELEKIDNVKFWEGGAYKEEEMFKYVSFKNINVPPEDLKYNQKQDQRCFTFSTNADRDTLESEDTQLNVVVNIMQETYLEGTVYEAGVKVYIDEPDTAPSYSDDAMMGVPVGTTTRIKLTKKEMKYLPTPYNSRGTDCLDTKASDFVNSLDWFKHYSFDGCLHECSNKAAMKASSIGGQIGLFLGASILTITELLELLTTCVLASLKSLWARHKLQG
ncbi:acid-sensing ion channel 1-like [Haliotis cracherodii]|uniref:acid-sensing ion channel 1-like n=1 Tax=Haliotis cracherodii TaxID=6455 RepID=UPI0039EBD293